MMNCSRRSCGVEGATCRHTQTGKMYCVPCARAINAHNPQIGIPLVVIPIRTRPIAEKIEQLRQAYTESPFARQSFRAHNTTVVTPQAHDQRLEALKSAMFCATNEQRLDAMADYCKGCGKSTVNEPCHCENEE